MTVDRDGILAHRIRVNGLDTRAPYTTDSLERAAHAGLQDSMPRAAVLSVHARVDDTPSDVWSSDPYVQVWGPRFSAFVVAHRDRGVFTLGRHPQEAWAQDRAVDIADRLASVLGDDTVTYSDAGRALGMNPNALRYATTTGRVVLRWEGAGKPTIRMVPPPEMDVGDARKELARRYLRVFGPTTEVAYAKWAGINSRLAADVFAELAPELTEVETPVGSALLLTADLPLLAAGPSAVDTVRLLPSGDTYYLLHGPDRTLLVPDAANREQLWTSRVWPGAVLVSGQVVGTWRRAKGRVSIHPWRRLAAGEQEALASEAESLPIPDVGRITVTWT